MGVGWGEGVYVCVCVGGGGGVVRVDVGWRAGSTVPNSKLRFTDHPFSDHFHKWLGHSRLRQVFVRDAEMRAVA